jgi:hypothetical protein
MGMTAYPKPHQRGDERTTSALKTRRAHKRTSAQNAHTTALVMPSTSARPAHSGPHSAGAPWRPCAGVPAPLPPTTADPERRTP